MTDFNVQVRVRSGRLLRRIRDKFGTTAAAARASGVSKTMISSLVTMRLSPTLKDGSFSKTAQNLAAALGCDAEEIWPAHMAAFVMRKSYAEMELAAVDVSDLIAGPEVGMMQRQLIAKWGKNLTPREMTTINMRQAGCTLEDVAIEIGLTTERARQIEARALRRMNGAAIRDGVRSYTDAMN
jgi:lambda repressor-like predicted transcriptional regulator